jgi:hypothetical protein
MSDFFQEPESGEELIDEEGRPQPAAQGLFAPGGNATVPDVAVARAGVAIATWQRGSVAQAAARTAAGAWGSPQTLSTTDLSASWPDVAADASGNAVAVWSGSDGMSSYIRASGFDGVGPRFDNLRVPSSAGVGLRSRSPPRHLTCGRLSGPARSGRSATAAPLPGPPSRTPTPEPARTR